MGERAPLREVTKRSGPARLGIQLLRVLASQSSALFTRGPRLRAVSPRPALRRYGGRLPSPTHLRRLSCRDAPPQRSADDNYVEGAFQNTRDERGEEAPRGEAGSQHKTGALVVSRSRVHEGRRRRRPTLRPSARHRKHTLNECARPRLGLALLIPRASRAIRSRDMLDRPAAPRPP